MFFGRYSITISNDGMVFNFFKDRLIAGSPYNVITNEEDESKGYHSLIYRFNDDLYENEKLIKSYRVRKDKFLRIPPSYRDLMCGRCFLIGIGNDIELVTFKSEEKREKEHENVSLESLIKEFEKL